MKGDQQIYAASMALVVMGFACLRAQAAEPVMSPADAALSEKSTRLGGSQPGQRFNAAALSIATMPPRTDTLTITIAPGNGVQVTAPVDAGQGFVFQWVATGELLVNTQGEPANSAAATTIYDIDAMQRQAAGTLVAPFSGKHGWYWRNQGADHVTVKVVVTGFQKGLLRTQQR
ncbi:MAG: hypothetical protein JNL93_16110 [Pelomonas sp.]|nr:hypothetical protein [Roseateles sp.]